MGATLEELQALRQLAHNRRLGGDAPPLGVCLDTAHLFASGYAVHTKPGLDSLVDTLQQSDLLQRVGRCT